MRLSEAEVKGALRRLDEQRLVVVDRDGCAIRMAHPLARFESAYRFESSGKRYYANCGWDVLALPPLLDMTGTIHALWTETGAEWRATSSPEAFDGPEGIVHFSVSAEPFWDNIGYT